MKYMSKRYINCFLQEYNCFTFFGCGLSDGEAAAEAERMFDTAEVSRAAECVLPGEIEHMTSRICYRLSLKRKFRAAVMLKRAYIPISLVLARIKFNDGKKNNHEN